MSNEEPEIEIDFNADLEGMGYELAGSIEFYENPETGLGAFRSLLFNTTLESSLEEGEDYTTGQELVLVTQAMLEQYLDSEKN
jgi:hypothetical protein